MHLENEDVRVEVEVGGDACDDCESGGERSTSEPIPEAEDDVDAGGDTSDDSEIAEAVEEGGVHEPFAGNITGSAGEDCDDGS